MASHGADIPRGVDGDAADVGGAIAGTEGQVADAQSDSPARAVLHTDHNTIPPISPSRPAAPPDAFFTPPQHRRDQPPALPGPTSPPLAAAPAQPAPSPPGQQGQAGQSGQPQAGSPAEPESAIPSEPGWVSRALRRLAGVNKPGLSESDTPLGRTHSQKPPK